MMTTELAIAHVGLGAQDVLRLKSVMVRAISEGLVKSQWRLGEPATANFIVAGAEEAARIDGALTPYAQSIIAVLAGESDPVVKGYRRLGWPIRLEELVAHLNMVETQVSTGTPAATPTHSLMRLAEVLRRPQAVPELALRIEGLTKSPTYFLPANKQCVSSDSLMRIGRFDMAREVRFDWIPSHSVPEAPDRRKPVVMLQWWVGLLAGTVGLLPWLTADGVLRLRRFPDFPILHHLPAHRRLAAALSRPALGLDAVVQLTGVEPAIVVGFVNAAEMCGYLVSADTAISATAQRHAPGSTRRSLVQVFRKALGIEGSNA